MWFFTKEGEISDGNVSVSFEELIAVLDSSNAGTINVPSNMLGETLTNNDLVYINQNDGMYYKAFVSSVPKQSQNLVGVYKRVNSKHTIQTGGIIKNFSTILIPGKVYYLSSTAGDVVANTTNKQVIVGRAVNNKDIILNIHGNIDIGTFAGFDTSIIDGESKEGVGLTDPSGTSKVSFNKVSYDPTLPSAIQFVDVNGTTIKLDVAGEYFGNQFSVTVGNNVYYGTFELNEDYNNPTHTSLDGVSTGDTTTGDTGDTTTGDTGDTGDTTTGDTGDTGGTTTGDTGDTGDTTTGDTGDTGGTAHNSYDTVLTGTETAEGIGMTDPNEGSDVTVSFDKLVYDPSVPSDIMFISVNGYTIKLDYQTEYLGKDIDAISDGVRYVGTIALNESYSSPTVLTPA